MVIIKQFTEELAICFQCCISSPLFRKCRIRTFNLVIDNNILHMTSHTVHDFKNDKFLRGVR